MLLFDKMISVSKGSVKIILCLRQCAATNNVYVLGLRKDSLSRGTLQKTMMYHCQYSAEEDATRMMEVPPTENSLESHSSFLIHCFSNNSTSANVNNEENQAEVESNTAANKKLYIWHGSASSSEARTTLMQYVSALQQAEEIQISEIEEGEEPVEFWTELGYSEVPENRKTKVLWCFYFFFFMPLFCSIERL